MSNAFFNLVNTTTSPFYKLRSFDFKDSNNLSAGAKIVFSSNNPNADVDITIDTSSISFNFGTNAETFTIEFTALPVNFTGLPRASFKFDSAPCTNPGKPNHIAPASISAMIASIANDSGYQKLFANISPQTYSDNIITLQSDFDNIVATSNPLYLVSLAINDLVNKQNTAKTISELQFGSDSQKNAAYLSALTNTKASIANCVSALVPSKRDTATQIGKFDDSLIKSLDALHNTLTISTSNMAKESAKKASGSGVSGKAPSTPAPVVSVNSSITDLETAQARAQADNQIVFVSGVSGVNLFTNPAGDPTNVYTILDIMRDEQSAFLFESTVVTLTDVPQAAPSPVNQCEKVFGKLTPKQLLALIKTINDQVDYNNRILERLQMVINRLGNASGLSALWAGVTIPKLALGQSPGGRGPVLDAIQQAVTNGLSNLQNIATQEGQQLLNAGETIYNQAVNNAGETIKFATNTFNDNSAQLIANIKANSKAMNDILSSLTDTDMALCSSLNDLAKVANAPQAMMDATAQLKAKSVSDLQKIQKHATDARLITDSQNSLDSIKTTLTNILKSKIGG